MKDLFSKCYNYTTADDLRAQGLFPYFRELESRQDTEVIMEGKRRLMMGSNNYLGLTTNPEIMETAKATIDEYGTGCSGSRLLNGTLILHLQFEKEMAEFLRKDDVVTFSTGFQSNLGIISAVAGPHDYIICDKENHASIYDGCKLSYAKMLRYKHNDMEQLELMLQKVPENAGALIVTDGVFSMGGDIANLPEIVRLGKKYGARIMVDDAHGLGTIGEGGRGTASYYGLEKEVDIYMGTFSKSLASLADYVRCNSRPYIFSASVPPACIAVATASLRHLKANPDLPKHLQELSLYMQSELKKRDVKFKETQVPIIPIYTYETLRTLKVQKALYERGLYVNASVPPATAPNEALLRVSLMATHTKEQIDEAVEIIAETLKEF